MIRRPLATMLFGLLCLGSLPAASSASGAESPALPEEPVPLADLPERPRPIVELGERYLAPSELSRGWRLPTGAVWQPSILVWGTARSALQGEFSRPLDRGEWANRLNLFGQVTLTPTERIVIGFEPLQKGTRTTGYRFGANGRDGEFVGGVDADFEAFFFEGDFGEMFPALDRKVKLPLDLGFMVGRVPVVFQDGFMIDDRMTAFGLVQNSILAHGTSNLRISALAAWDAVHRGGDNVNGGDTVLVGLFSELDRYETTWSLDLAFADGKDDGQFESDGFFGGLSAIRRVRDRWNVTARLLGSLATQDEGPAVADGLLAVLGVSVAPRGTHDVLYLNLMGAAGRYTSAARGPDRGGPLNRIGILFEAPGIGRIGSPLPDDANRVLGGALGYQKFLGEERRTQIVVEFAGRTRHDTSAQGGYGAGLRIQQALGRRIVLRFDLYGISRRDIGGFGGARSEIVLKL